MSEPLVYLRDASWYRSPGRAGRYHWPHPDEAGMSACGRVAIVSDWRGERPGRVETLLRCKSPGCAKRYRDHDKRSLP